MKNYTLIVNEIFEPSQLTLPAKFLFCILRRHCGQDDACFPGQKTLASQMNMTSRMVRSYLKELELNGLIRIKRTGFNRVNTYEVAKELVIDGKLVSHRDGKSIVNHIGNKFPFNNGSGIPPKITYRKAGVNKGLSLIQETLRKKGLLSAAKLASLANSKKTG